MYTLPVKPRLWLKSLHIVSAGMWVGGGSAMLVLTLAHRTAGLPTLPAYDGAVQAVGVTIPGGVTAMVTGLGFSLFTPWGFLRHTWVTVKWVITLGCILAGALWLGPTLGRVADMSAAAMTGEPYVSAHRMFVAGHVLQTLLVFFMVVISTPKALEAVRGREDRSGSQGCWEIAPLVAIAPLGRMACDGMAESQCIVLAGATGLIGGHVARLPNPMRSRGWWLCTPPGRVEGSCAF